MDFITNGAPSVSDCLINEFNLSHLAVFTFAFMLVINSNNIRGDIVSLLISEKYSSLGDFESCLSIEYVASKTFSDATSHFKGKYCLVSVQVPELNHSEPIVVNSSKYLAMLGREWLQMRNRNMLLQSICVPSLCNADQ